MADRDVAAIEDRYVESMGVLNMLVESADRALTGCIQHKWQFSAICPICSSVRHDLQNAVARAKEILS